MSRFNAAALALRLRLAMRGLGPVAGAAFAMCLIGGASLIWLAPRHALQADSHRLAMRLAARPLSATAIAVPAANLNLVRFYDTLGEQRYAEQQVKTLFALAGKSGLSLSRGDYKGAYDAKGRLHTYQVTLPVKGSYRDVWQFSLAALMAIPFASLDEVSFRRDNINDPAVEARLRLTLYLADQPEGARR